MKKTLILAAMLSVGYAAAQYDEKVGINTETPSATLNVKTKNNTTSPKNLELENAGGTKLMTVLNGGNVGINTDAPTEKLHINEGNLKVLRTSGGAGPFLELNNPSKSGDTQANYWRLYNATGAYGDVLLFYPYNSKNAGLHSSAAFSFTDDAKFGIGLNKPEEKLHVASGNVKINDLPSNAGSDTDKVVVVDNTGVLKSVDRSAIGGNTGGTTLGALTGKIHKAPSITAGQWKTDGIFLFIQTSNDTIKLPNPADFTNKIISVNNAAGQGLNYAGEYSPHHTSTLDGGKGHILMSDGTDWYVIGGSY